MHTSLKGDRYQIGIFGNRNAGKSSLVNGLTGQELAIVSDVKGTTTDPVSKAMELLPIGPCLLIDTPGIDDEGGLGKQRVQKTAQVLATVNFALLVCNVNEWNLAQENTNENTKLFSFFDENETKIWEEIKKRKIPAMIVCNQIDSLDARQLERLQAVISQTREYFSSLQNTGKEEMYSAVCVSCVSKMGQEELKNEMIRLVPQQSNKLHLIGDFIKEKDIIILVMPIDSSAPKGRLIMPQQQTIRDILDHHGISVVVQVQELAAALDLFANQVKMVVTDSQAFHEVNQIVPKDIALTSFSILMARHKGDLKYLSEAVRKIGQLKDGDLVLIAEGCTHHRQCEDIGTVKIPKWLREFSKKEIVIETCSGHSFPQDLSKYAMVIHCGGCTLHQNEMQRRMKMAREQKIPMINYGILIAYVNGILDRSIRIFPEINGGE